MMALCKIPWDKGLLQSLVQKFLNSSPDPGNCIQNLWVCVYSFLSENIQSFGEIHSAGRLPRRSEKSMLWHSSPQGRRSCGNLSVCLAYLLHLDWWSEKSLEDLSLVLLQPSCNLLIESDVKIHYSRAQSCLHFVHYSWVISHLMCVCVCVCVCVCMRARACARVRVHRQQWPSQ